MSQIPTNPFPHPLPNPMPAGRQEPILPPDAALDSIGRRTAALAESVRRCVDASCTEVATGHDALCACITQCVNDSLRTVDAGLSEINQGLIDGITAALYSVYERAKTAGCQLPSVSSLVRERSATPAPFMPLAESRPTPAIGRVVHPPPRNVTPPPSVCHDGDPSCSVGIGTVGGGLPPPIVLCWSVWYQDYCYPYYYGCIVLPCGQSGYPLSEITGLQFGSPDEAAAWVAANCLPMEELYLCGAGVPPPVPVPVPVPVPTPIPGPVPTPCPPCPPVTCPPPPPPCPDPVAQICPPPVINIPPCPPTGGTAFNGACIGVRSCGDNADPCKDRPIHVIVSFCPPKSNCEHPDFFIGGGISHNPCDNEHPVPVIQLDADGRPCPCPPTALGPPVVTDQNDGSFLVLTGGGWGPPTPPKPPTGADDRIWCLATRQVLWATECLVYRCGGQIGAAWHKDETVQYTWYEAVELATKNCGRITSDARPVAPTTPTEPLTETQQSLVTLALPDWSSLDICRQIDIGIGVAQAQAGITLTQVLGFRDANNLPAYPAWLLKNAGSWAENFVMKGILDSFRGIVENLITVAEWVPKTKNCSWPMIIVPTAWKAILGMVQKWTGADVDEFKRPYDYLRSYICPTELPSASEATECYLSDTITLDLWRCWTRSNGVMDTPAYQTLQARWSKVSAEEAIRLWGASLITEAEKNQLVRSWGWVQPRNVQMLHMASIDYPGTADIIRFMVRNAGDEMLVAATNADAEFTEKYTAQLQQWGGYNRVPPEIAKYHWRAHWQIPSVGQLWEMLHRLRPGAVPDELVLTPAALGYGFQENEIHPFWRERLKAVSYRPLTRVDAQRAYIQGSLSRDALVGVYQDIGYTAENAEKLAAFSDNLAKTRRANSRWLRLYRRGGISRDKVLEQTRIDGLPDSAVSLELDRIDLEASAASVRKCVDAARKRYLAGELDADRVSPLLKGYGLDQSQAISLARQWECERSARGRHAAAAQLCRWARLGLLSLAEYKVRLERIGWPAEDVARVVAECDRTRPKTGPQAGGVQAVRPVDVGV